MLTGTMLPEDFIPVENIIAIKTNTIYINTVGFISIFPNIYIYIYIYIYISFDDTTIMNIFFIDKEQSYDWENFAIG